MALLYSDLQRLQKMIERRSRLLENLGLTRSETATLGAVDLVENTRGVGGDLDDAVDLVRRVWNSGQGVPR